MGADDQSKTIAGRLAALEKHLVTMATATKNVVTKINTEHDATTDAMIKGLENIVSALGEVATSNDQ